MALKLEVEEAELESLGALKEHYGKGTDGKYRPIGEDNEVLVNGTKAMTALQNERAAKRALDAKLAAYAEIEDPAAAREALKKVKDMESWTPKEQVEQVAKARVEQVVATHKTELEKRAEREKKLESQLHRVVVENDARVAMAELGLDAMAQDLLFPKIMANLRMVEKDGRLATQVVDALGNEILSKEKNDGTSMPVKELVGTYRSTYARIFPGTGSSGGGAGGGAGGVTPPVAQGGVRLIKNSDLDAKKKYILEIASGDARVIEG